MNSKFQTYGILLITLLIGILLGFLINGQVYRNRMQKARASFQDREGRIEQILDKVALPDSQREVILPVFEKHFGKMKGIHRRFRREVRGEMEDFRGELSQYLDEDQMRQLEAEMRLFRKRPPRRGLPDHPPGHMPPPGPEAN